MQKIRAQYGAAIAAACAQSSSVLGNDARMLDEVLQFMEAKGWAKPSGYKETYEIF